MYYIYDVSGRIDSYNRIFMELYALHDSNGYMEHIVIMSDPMGQTLPFLDDIVKLIGGGAVVKVDDSEISLVNINNKIFIDTISNFAEADESDIVSMFTKEISYSGLYVKIARMSFKDILSVRFTGNSTFMDARMNIDYEVVRIRKLDPSTRPGSLVLSNLVYLYMDLSNLVREKEKIRGELETIIEEFLERETVAIITFTGQYSVRYPYQTYTPLASWLYLRIFDDLVEKLEKYSDLKQIAKFITRYKNITRSQKKIQQLETMIRKPAAAKEEKHEIKIE
jgi:hypothetical protein